MMMNNSNNNNKTNKTNNNKSMSKAKYHNWKQTDNKDRGRYNTKMSNNNNKESCNNNNPIKRMRSTINRLEMTCKINHRVIIILKL